MIVVVGYPVASAYGPPDTGYIACQEMCDTVKNVVRQANVPVMADGDTGYGSPMNVKRMVGAMRLPALPGS
jgi:2-methylisocitrate lyase-like PEP mutase family enzyme